MIRRLNSLNKGTVKAVSPCSVSHEDTKTRRHEDTKFSDYNILGNNEDVSHPLADIDDCGLYFGLAFWERINVMNGHDHDLDLSDRIQSELSEISRTFMPFGRYGPVHFPPRGVPIYDLPAEYLNYFAVKGFPKGRLGELLRIVYQTKLDGADAVFDEIREQAGGRTPFRKTRTRKFKF